MSTLKDLLQEVRNEIERSMEGGLIPWEMGQAIKMRRLELIEKIDAALKSDTVNRKEFVGLSDRAKLHFVRVYSYSSVSVLDFIDAIEIELRGKNT